jgi:hypothetical protein
MFWRHVANGTAEHSADLAATVLGIERNIEVR